MFTLFDLTEDAQRVVLSMSQPLTPIHLYHTSTEARACMRRLVVPFVNDNDFKIACTRGDILSILYNTSPHGKYLVDENRLIVGLVEALKTDNDLLIKFLVLLPVRKGKEFFQEAFKVACKEGTFSAAAKLAHQWAYTHGERLNNKMILIKIFKGACLQGNIRLLDEALRKVPHSHKSWRPMHVGLSLACKKGDMHLFSFFLEHLSGVLPDPLKPTILEHALEGGKALIIAKLLEMGALQSPRVVSHARYNIYEGVEDLVPVLTLVPRVAVELLYHASSNNNSDMFERVWAQSKGIFRFSQEHINSAFLRACASPNIRITDDLIQKLLNLGANNFDEALMELCTCTLACKSSQPPLELILFLIEKEASNIREVLEKCKEIHDDIMPITKHKHLKPLEEVIELLVNKICTV